MQFDQIRLLVAEMHSLLQQHDAGQQRIPFAVIEAIDRQDYDEARRLLQWGGIWGGMGSIEDVVLYRIPWKPTFRIDEADNDRLKVLLQRLRLEMQNLNIVRPW